MTNLTPEVNNPIQLSIVVPIFNEEAILMSMAEQLAPHMDEIAGRGHWQFVLVENGSSDTSPDVCEKIVKKWPLSIIVSLQHPNYGEALYQGLMQAQAPWAFLINTDFWDISFIRWCFGNRGAYHLVMGSKRADAALNQQDNYRRLLSWGLNTALQTIFGFVGSDTHGQKFMHLPSMRPIFRQCVMRRGQFDTEFTLRASRAQLWLAEVPVPIVELRGARNLMLHKIMRNLVDIFRLYRAMQLVPVRAALRYHRWAREDVEAGESARGMLLAGIAHHNVNSMVTHDLMGASINPES